MKYNEQCPQYTTIYNEYNEQWLTIAYNTSTMLLTMHWIKYLNDNIEKKFIVDNGNNSIQYHDVY